MTLRTSLIALLTALLLAGGGAATAAQRATLRVVRSAPLRLQGAGFHRAERVVVTVQMGAGRWTARTRADSAGAFTSDFTRLRLRACSLPLALTARGSRGDVAHAVLPLRDCAPD